MKINGPLPLKDARTAEVKARDQDQQLKDAAEMYEQHFMREMVKAMRQATPEGGLMETSFGERIYREQLDNQYVENWTKRGGVGLADMIYQSIKERYFPSRPEGPRPSGPLPLQPQNGKGPEFYKLETKNDTRGAQFRFQGAPQLSPEDRQVTAPFSGRIENVFKAENGWSKMKINHDQGLVSQLTFRGQLEKVSVGETVEAGETLGLLDSVAPELHWELLGPLNRPVLSTGPRDVVG